MSTEGTAGQGLGSLPVLCHLQPEGQGWAGQDTLMPVLSPSPAQTDWRLPKAGSRCPTPLMALVTLTHNQEKEGALWEGSANSAGSASLSHLGYEWQNARELQDVGFLDLPLTLMK